MKIINLLFLVAFVLLPSRGWSKSVVPVWYLGGWEYQSCDSKNIMCLTKDFSFNSNGTYNIDAYPEAHHSGKYKISTISDNQAVLNLSDQKGDWAPWKSQIKVIFDPVKNTLNIDGEGPYLKLNDIIENHKEPNEK